MSEFEHGESEGPKTEDWLTELAVELGFEEPEELVLEREALKEIKDPTEFAAAANDYFDRSSRYFDRKREVPMENDEVENAQIGRDLITAAIYYAQGMFAAVDSNLKAAMGHAFQRQDDELVRKIDDIWTRDPRFKVDYDFDNWGS